MCSQGHGNDGPAGSEANGVNWTCHLLPPRRPRFTGPGAAFSPLSTTLGSGPGES